MSNKNWSQRAEPFSNINEYETEEGLTLEVGDNVLVKPQYVSERLPATVERIYWDPQGLPGGKFDHRGKVVSKPDYGKEDPGEYPIRKTRSIRLYLKGTIQI